MVILFHNEWLQCAAINCFAIKIALNYFIGYNFSDQDIFIQNIKSDKIRFSCPNGGPYIMWLN